MHFIDKELWKNSYNDWDLTQNCQNFAHMLFERVAVTKSDGRKGLLDPNPDP